MAPHSSTLAWKIPWTEEEPGGLQSMGSLRVGHDWATSLSLFTFMHWRRKWQPTPVFLPRESQGRGSLVGPGSVGSHRVGHNWSDLAAAAGSPKNSRFWTLVLDKTLESPLNSKIQPVHPKGNQSWIFIGSWNSNTLATWCKELTHWKKPWCQQRLKVGGEGDNRGWDGWMASLTGWT